MKQRWKYIITEPPPLSLMYKQLVRAGHKIGAGKIKIPGSSFYQDSGENFLSVLADRGMISWLAPLILNEKS